MIAVIYNVRFYTKKYWIQALSLMHADSELGFRKKNRLQVNWNWNGNGNGRMCSE